MNEDRVRLCIVDVSFQVCLQGCLPAVITSHDTYMCVPWTWTVSPAATAWRFFKPLPELGCGRVAMSTELNGRALMNLASGGSSGRTQPLTVHVCA